MGFRIAAINGMGEITEPSPGDFQTTGMIDAGVMNMANNFIYASGVNGLPGTSLQVSATSPASDQVEVAIGSCYVQNDGYSVGGDEVGYWEVSSDSAELVTIPSNSSGNPRIDLICMEVDPVPAPGPDGDANCELVVVQGTPAGSPTAPAVPAKHTVLAQVAVANGFTTITSGNITDRRQTARLDGGKVEPSWNPANEIWTYAGASAPNFTLTIPGDQTGKYSAGMRVRLSQSTGGTKYFLICRVVYSAPSTTLTLYGGGTASAGVYTLNNEAISSPVYSWQKAPHGFPLDEETWSIVVTDNQSRSISTPTQNVWANPNSALSVSMPVGSWKLSYKVLAGITASAITTAIAGLVTLSTANNSESHPQLTTCAWFGAVDTMSAARSTVGAQQSVSVTSATTWYINLMTPQTTASAIQVRGDTVLSVIKLVSAYL